MERKYPIDRKMRILRKREDGLYEQRDEHWQQLAESSPFSCPKKLVFSVPTGRVFRLMGRSNTDIEGSPPPEWGTVLSIFDPDTFEAVCFSLVEGGNEDLTVVGYSEKTIGESEEAGLSAARSRGLL
jgi:hypothetical protein